MSDAVPGLNVGTAAIHTSSPLPTIVSEQPFSG